MNDERDYLSHLTEEGIDTRPGFSELWAPYAPMLDLSAERVRLRLSQQEVAERMGIGLSAVASMENRPEGASLARYAQAVGGTLKVVPGDGTPKPAGGAGRPVVVRTRRRAA